MEYENVALERAQKLNWILTALFASASTIVLFTLLWNAREMSTTTTAIVAVFGILSSFCSTQAVSKRKKNGERKGSWWVVAKLALLTLGCVAFSIFLGVFAIASGEPYARVVAAFGTAGIIVIPLAWFVTEALLLWADWAIRRRGPAVKTGERFMFDGHMLIRADPTDRHPGILTVEESRLLQSGATWAYFAGGGLFLGLVFDCDLQITPSPEEEQSQ